MEGLSVRSLLKLEEEADAIVQRARERAEEILRRAREEAKRIIEEARRRAEEIERFNGNGGNRAEELRKEDEELARTVIELGMANLPKALERVMREITGESE